VQKRQKIARERLNLMTNTAGTLQSHQDFFSTWQERVTLKKFSNDDEIYFNYISSLSELEYSNEEIIYNFTTFVGSVNLARFLSFYEIYQDVKKISGDIADIGTYLGGSMFTFAKLVKLFEPYSNTRVHGFDWFKGQIPGDNDDKNQLGKYITSKDKLERLIGLQGLSGFVELHDLDLTSDLPKFVEENPWMRFKCIFLDCGIEGVMESTLKNFWPLLVPGGILILDHFNSSVSPQESKLVDKYSGGAIIQSVNFSRTPTAYLQKKS